jgi:hypothetical protein
MALYVSVSMATSVVGSLIGVAIAFHFDLEGALYERRHRRMIRRGERLDKRSGSR